MDQLPQTDGLTTLLCFMILSFQLFQFLVCNNFKKTIRALTEEIEGTPFKLPKLLPAKKERIEKDDVFKILSAMEMEDHLQFFEVSSWFLLNNFFKVGIITWYQI